MQDLEDVHRRIGHAEAVGGALRAGHLVAHRLEQPPHAPGADRGAEQQRHAEIVAGLAREVLQHLLAGGRLVHQQLFEQLVVMVRELFEHVGARFDLAVLKVGGDLDALGFLVRRDI